MKGSNLSWDVSLVGDGNLSSEYPHAFKNCTAVHPNWFQKDELEYKARNSKVCIISELCKSIDLDLVKNCGCQIVFVKYPENVEETKLKVRTILEKS